MSLINKLILLVLISTPAFAGVPSPNSQVGWNGSRDPSAPVSVLPASQIASDGAKNICASTGSLGSASGAYYWFFDQATGLQYVPTTGKTFKAPGFSATVSGASSPFTLGYATAVFAHATTTPPTGAKYFAGDRNAAWFSSINAETAPDHYYQRRIEFTGGNIPFLEPIVSSQTVIICATGYEN